MLFRSANILVVRETGHIKITDFGLAMQTQESRLSLDGTWAGTPMFMSPEQFTSHDIDHRTDLFSLGSLLYTLCAGIPPFPCDSVPVVMNQICNGEAPPLLAHRPDVPVWLVKLIARLHAKTPAGRIQSAAEVAAALEKQGN